MPFGRFHIAHLTFAILAVSVLAIPYDSWKTAPYGTCLKNLFWMAVHRQKTGILNGPETAWLLCKYNLLVCGHWCFDSPAVQQTISIQVKSGKVSVWLVEMRAKTIAFTVWLVISWCYACTCDAGHMWHHVASIIHHNTKVRSCYIIMLQ